MHILFFSGLQSANRFFFSDLHRFSASPSVSGRLDRLLWAAKFSTEFCTEIFRPLSSDFFSTFHNSYRSGPSGNTARIKARRIE